MFDNDMNDMPSRSDEPSSSVSGYLNSAEQAAEQGNLMLRCICTWRRSSAVRQPRGLCPPKPPLPA